MSSREASVEGQKTREGRGGRPRRERAPKTVLEEGLEGTVKWYSLRSRYGFIERADGKEDVYVHRNSIRYKFVPNTHQFPTLGDGEKVVFNLVEGRNGKPEAWDVTGPGGEKLKGHSLAIIKWHFLSEEQKEARNQRRQERRKERRGSKASEGEGKDGSGDAKPRRRERRRGPKPEKKEEAEAEDTKDETPKEEQKKTGIVKSMIDRVANLGIHN